MEGAEHVVGADVGDRDDVAVAQESLRVHAEADADAQHQVAIEEGELARAVIREAAIGIIIYDATSGACVSANDRAARIEDEQRRKLDKDRGDELRIIRSSAVAQILELIGGKLTEAWGQTVVPDNRAGANGLDGDNISGIHA